MKFYGTGIVWNPEADKALCQFDKGELETFDAGIIAKLKKLGYKHDGESDEKEPDKESEEEQKEPDEIAEEFDALTDEELKVLAKKNGIKGFGIMKRDTLIAKLREV